MKNDDDLLIKSAWGEIDKKYGKGSVWHGHTIVQDVEAIPTGSLALDIALGIGGLPRGRFVEIYGPEASGKTTLVLEIIKNVQESKGKALFIDMEHALDSIYAKQVGVDVDKLFISQPDYGEQAFEIAEKFCKTNAFDLIAIDSAAALITKAEIEGDMGDVQMGSQARLMSQALRKLTSFISKTKTCFVFTNQLREKIGIMFGNPEVTPGGRALKFWSSVRMEIRRKTTVKQGDIAVANIVQAKVQKNKVAPPFRHADFKIVFGKGIARSESILDVATQCGVIERSGTWFKSLKALGGIPINEKFANGMDQAAEFLDQHPEFAKAVEKATREEVLKRDVIVTRPDQDESVQEKDN